MYLQISTVFILLQRKLVIATDTVVSLSCQYDAIQNHLASESQWGIILIILAFSHICRILLMALVEVRKPVHWITPFNNQGILSWVRVKKAHWELAGMYVLFYYSLSSTVDCHCHFKFLRPWHLSPPWCTVTWNCNPDINPFSSKLFCWNIPHGKKSEN